MSKKLSDRQLAAIRANAQKSTGPRTPEGKDRSCMNAWKHGITSTRVCLDTENRPDVDSIAVIHWHIDRLRFMESLLIQAEIYRPGMTGDVSNVSDLLMPAFAFRYLCDHSNVVSLLNTQLNRLSREHARLHETFLKMRKEHPPISPAVPEIESDPAEQQPPNQQNEHYPQNEPGEMQPAAISNIRSIVYKAMPLEPGLTRAA